MLSVHFNDACFTPIRSYQWRNIMSQATQTQALHHTAAWFEIPTADFDRARKFYEAAFDTTLREEGMGDMKMGVFPHKDDEVTGCIMASPFSKPSTDGSGSTVYIQPNGDLQDVLNRAKKLGSQVLVQKTALPAEQGGGYFAVMTDSEGNRVGLFSRQ
jgi:uncharacterized protein